MSSSLRLDVRRGRVHEHDAQVAVARMRNLDEQVRGDPAHGGQVEAHLSVGLVVVSLCQALDRDPIPTRSHTRSSVHNPPSRRESTTSTASTPAAGPGTTPAPATPSTPSCSGDGNREIEDANGARVSRATFSARQEVWITFAVDTPGDGCRTLCASCTQAATELSLFDRRV